MKENKIEKWIAIIYLSFAVNIEEKKKNSIDELLITNSLSVMK